MSGLAMDDHCRYALPAVGCLFVWLGSFWRDQSGNVAHGQSAPRLEVGEDTVARSSTQPFAGRGRGLTAGLVSGILAVRAFTGAPHFLSQTNFAAARLDTSFHYSGSNLAWGQGLMELRDWCSVRGLSEPIGLLYFESIDPLVYGIRWQHPELQQPFPQWVFVSTNLVCPPRQTPVYQPQGRTMRMSVARLLNVLSEFQVDDPPKGFVASKTR